MAEIEWKDVSDEHFRLYVFPGGDQIRIDEPKRLAVSASGGHRVEDAEGVAHYIPPRWIHLYWTVKDGRPLFAF